MVIICKKKICKRYLLPSYSQLFIYFVNKLLRNKIFDIRPRYYQSMHRYAPDEL